MMLGDGYSRKGERRSSVVDVDIICVILFKILNVSLVALK